MVASPLSGAPARGRRRRRDVGQTGEPGAGALLRVAHVQSGLAVKHGGVGGVGGVEGG